MDSGSSSIDHSRCLGALPDPLLKLPAVIWKEHPLVMWMKRPDFWDSLSIQHLTNFIREFVLVSIGILISLTTTPTCCSCLLFDVYLVLSFAYLLLLWPFTNILLYFFTGLSARAKITGREQTAMFFQTVMICHLYGDFVVWHSLLNWWEAFQGDLLLSWWL